LKKRFLGIPVVAILATILALGIVGVAAASAITCYTFSTQTANVQVQEALTIDCVGGNGSYADGIWTVSMYPGESKYLEFAITNASSVSLPLIISVAGDYSNSYGVTLTMAYLDGSTWVSWDGTNGTIPSGTMYVALFANASAEAIPYNALPYTITFQR
jgi:hypothetical protein